MQVEKANRGNVLEVMYLLNHCIEDFNKNSVYQWNHSYPDYNKLVHEVEKGTLYIIKYKGVGIGTITFDMYQEPVFDSVDWKNKTDKFLVIHRIAVFPTWQKKGIGRKLIEFVESFAKENNYNSIRLDVTSSSEHIIKLYESIGYAFTGEILYPKQKETFKCLEKII
ncbi:MAG: GNAT family N-acetyltransferase [Bacteroidales bacterium]|jgi:ribosomal protein S18 acetylase RimI-like enzyme|nr:GNAT family N-acetyltransferase [Bacteroidales bacterium]